MPKVLLTGGSGLLGQELQKYVNFDSPTHEELDIEKVIELENKYRLIVHCAGYTDVAKAEIEKEKCFRTNVIGTARLLKNNRDVPFIYISSEYANNPVNWYGKTKLEAEKIIESCSNNYLIIRTLFKPKPYPFKYAFVDQYTQGDYLDIIAMLIISTIEQWDGEGKVLTYVGTGRKTMYELAKQTRPDVKPNSVDDIKEVKLPKDYV